MANKASKKDLDKINKKLKKVEKKLDPEIKEELTKEIEIKQEVETTENNDVELSKKKNVTLEPSSL